MGRKVVVEFTVTMAIDFPEGYDEAHINFALNEGTHCNENEVEQLMDEIRANQRVSPHTCVLCQRSKLRYVREASESDVAFLTRGEIL